MREAAMRRFLRGRNPLSSLFAPSRREQHLVRYVVREHARGRSLGEVLGDAYVRNRTSPDERARLLDRPELVAAIGAQAVDELKHAAAVVGDAR
jgi:hypothetical protein